MNTETIRTKYESVKGGVHEYDSKSQALLSFVNFTIEEVERAQAEVVRAELVLKAVKAYLRMYHRGFELGGDKALQYRNLGAASNEAITEFIIYLNGVGRKSEGGSA